MFLSLLFSFPVLDLFCCFYFNFFPVNSFRIGGMGGVWTANSGPGASVGHGDPLLVKTKKERKNNKTTHNSQHAFFSLSNSSKNKGLSSLFQHHYISILTIGIPTLTLFVSFFFSLIFL